MLNLIEIGLGFLERIFNFVNVFALFHYHHFLEKGVVLHLNKLESTSPDDALCKVEIGPLILKKNFL